MRFGFDARFLHQAAVVAVAGADEYARVTAFDGAREHPRIFQAAPGQFEQDALLRIGDLCFVRIHAEKSGVEARAVGQEAATVDTGIVGAGRPAAARCRILPDDRR